MHASALPPECNAGCSNLDREIRADYDSLDMEADEDLSFQEDLERELGCALRDSCCQQLAVSHAQQRQQRRESCTAVQAARPQATAAQRPHLV